MREIAERLFERIAEWRDKIFFTKKMSEYSYWRR